MKFAVSNIAWTVAEDEVAHDMLRELGATSLEIAPTRWWPDLAAVSEIEARTVAEKLGSRGLPVCGFQALFFGRPGLQVFGADGGRACLDYLRTIYRLAGWMGAGALVFGSPKNRLRGSLPPPEAFEKGCEFFRKAGDAAAAAGVVLCLEPNPPAYGADFLTTASEAAELVREVASPGLALNLDMGELLINGADVGAVVTELLPLAGHFHVSEPDLVPFNPDCHAHQQAAAALRAANHPGIVSVEMKAPPGGLAVVRASIAAATRVYFA